MNEIGSGHYFNNHILTKWINARLNKLTTLLGQDWFQGKRVLEVGCGHARIGRALANLGAQMVFTDARQEHLDFLLKDGFDARVMDQDKAWTVDGPFDLIVHFGVLYHLDNWKQDLKCAVDRSPLIALETEIWDSTHPEFERKMEDEKGYDQAFNGVGTILSAQHVEAYLTSLGATFTRYDDVDLDADTMVYSWKEGTRMETIRKEFERGQRRFWMVGRSVCL